MDYKDISVTTLRRLPFYLHYLQTVRNIRANISSSSIASYFGLNDVQVRKDLASVSGSGRPRTGYDIPTLISQIESCLGCGQSTKAVLIGAGNLGKALLSFEGFKDYGLSIAAAFDTDPAVIGTLVSGRTVLPLAELERTCSEECISLGIIATPAQSAQSLCDRLIAGGIKAIWNFAPTFLRVPSGVLVENENLASSLAILSMHLRHDKAEVTQ